MKKTIIILSFMLLLGNDNLFAYSPSVHPKITEASLKINENVTNSYLSAIGLTEGISQALNNKKIGEWLEEGSVKEDYTVDIVTSHFYNPLTDKGVSPSQSAYERASELWGFARGELYRGLTTPAATDSERKAREKILAGVFETVGRILHLIQDMAVPAHTREDLHMADSYESFVSSSSPELLMPPIPFQFLRTTSDSAPREFWDTDSSGVSNSTAIGLTNYSNVNFFSDGTIFKEFEHPAKELTNYSAVFASLPVTKLTIENVEHNDLHISGYDTEHLAAFNYFSAELMESPNSDGARYDLALFLNSHCHKDYAAQLIPRAVGYSAGMLDYFFRGKMEVMEPEEIRNDSGDITGVTLAVKNLTSGERMESGTLAVTCQHDTGSAIATGIFMAQGLDYDKESQRMSFAFQQFVPENTDLLECTLAFKGRLGSEEGAVIGQTFSVAFPEVVLAAAHGGTISVTAYFPTIGEVFGTVDAGHLLHKESVTFDVLNPSYIAVSDYWRDYAEFRLTYTKNGIYGKEITPRDENWSSKFGGGEYSHDGYSLLHSNDGCSYHQSWSTERLPAKLFLKRGIVTMLRPYVKWTGYDISRTVEGKLETYSYGIGRVTSAGYSINGSKVEVVSSEQTLEATGGRLIIEADYDSIYELSGQYSLDFSHNCEEGGIHINRYSYYSIFADYFLLNEVNDVAALATATFGGFYSDINCRYYPAFGGKIIASASTSKNCIFGGTTDENFYHIPQRGGDYVFNFPGSASYSSYGAGANKFTLYAQDNKQLLLDDDAVYYSRDGALVSSFPAGRGSVSAIWVRPEYQNNEAP